LQCQLNDPAKLVVIVAVLVLFLVRERQRISNAEILAKCYVAVGTQREALEIRVDDSAILLKEATTYRCRDVVVLNAGRPEYFIQPVGTLPKRSWVGILRNGS
jgi:hypothetical protein